MLVNLCGAIALLLWGLRMVRTGMTRGFGNELRKALGRSLGNRFSSFFTGLGVTVLLQSSTATSLLTASFAGRGLVAATPGLAVLLGADVGTTLVAQLLSFDLSHLMPILLVSGTVMFMSSKTSRTKNIGRIVLGLGQMLLALNMIVAASAPARNSEIAQTLLSSLSGEPVLAILFAALLTWMAHSSLATVLLIVGLATTGTIGSDIAFAFVLGANLGGALPPVVATLGADAPARRPALGNLLFRVTGVVMVLPLLPYLTPWIAEIDANTSRQIVNFHTAFNLGLALLFLPAVSLMAQITELLVPDRKLATDGEIRPMYLDRGALDSPQVALAYATRETMRMGDILEEMFRDIETGILTNDIVTVKRAVAKDDLIDDFYVAIKTYLTELSREPLGDEDSLRCTAILTFTTNLEHVGDILELNIAEMAERKAKANIVLPHAEADDLGTLFQLVGENMKLAFSFFISGDKATAHQLLALKKEFQQRERAAVDQHMLRLRQGQCDPGDASGFHLDILRDLRRINSHLVAVVYPTLDGVRAGKPKILLGGTGPEEQPAE